MLPSNTGDRFDERARAAEAGAGAGAAGAAAAWLPGVMFQPSTPRLDTLCELDPAIKPPPLPLLFIAPCARNVDGAVRMAAAVNEFMGARPAADFLGENGEF